MRRCSTCIDCRPSPRSRTISQEIFFLITLALSRKCKISWTGSQRRVATLTLPKAQRRQRYVSANPSQTIHWIPRPGKRPDTTACRKNHTSQKHPLQLSQHRQWCELSNCPAFGTLRNTVWKGMGISTDTKLEICGAVVLPTLLFTSKTWTVYERRHAKVWSISTCYRCAKSWK